MKSFTIIGAGKVGCVIARTLVSSSWTLNSVFDTAPEKARYLVESLRVGTVAENLSSLRPADVIWLTVTDDQITPVALALAGLHLVSQQVMVIHVSGCKTIDDLTSLQGKCRLCSIHPLTSIADSASSGLVLAHVPMALEAEDQDLSYAEEITRALGGDSFRIRSDQKQLYHAAAVLFSNLLIGLLHAGEQTLTRAGIATKDLSRPLWSALVDATIANVLRQGTLEALTGPLIRGDIRTLRGHKAALAADYPELWTIYRAISFHLITSLRAARPEIATQFDEIMTLLTE